MPMVYRILRVTFLIWAGLVWADSEDIAEALPRLNLEHLVEEALTNNPDIIASLHDWKASQAVIPQVQTLPDPRVALGYKDMASQEVMYGMSQAIPFPGKLRLKGEIASSESERMEQDYLATQLSVIARLKELYFELHLVHKSVEVVSKNKLLLEDFEQTANVRYSVGHAAQQDVLRAQTEISRLLARLTTLDQRRQSIQAEINRLLNRAPGDPLGRPEEIWLHPMQHTLAELNTLLDKSSPLLRGQQRAVERDNRAIALARREYYPDFELSALGLRNTSMSTDGYQVALNVRIPLFYATRQRKGVDEAVANRESVFQDLQALRQELLARIKDNVARAESAQRLVKLLEEAIIPQSRLTLASAQASYSVGKVDFLTLLNSLLTLQENELEFHAEMTAHEQAMARLEGLVGETP